MQALATTAPLTTSQAWQEWELLKEMAKLAHTSGLLPQSIKSPQQALVIMLKGRELGLPPMYALSAISVINGKPCLSGELMVALIYKKHPTATIEVTTPPEKAAHECEVELERPDGKPQRFRFTLDDAKRAGLLGKQPWQQYPQQMLRWRAISMGARVVFPDAIMGCYLPEEVAPIDVAAAPAPAEAEPTPRPHETPPAPVSLYATDAPPRPRDSRPITDAQRRRLYAIAEQYAWPADEVKRLIQHWFNKAHSSELSRDEYAELVRHLETETPITATEAPVLEFAVGSPDDIRQAAAETGGDPLKP